VPRVGRSPHNPGEDVADVRVIYALRRAQARNHAIGRTAAELKVPAFAVIVYRGERLRLALQCGFWTSCGLFVVPHTASMPGFAPAETSRMPYQTHVYELRSANTRHERRGPDRPLMSTDRSPERLSSERLAELKRPATAIALDRREPRACRAKSHPDD
jgi:hypothetical protein